MAGYERHIADGLGDVDAYAKGVEHDMFSRTITEGALGGLAVTSLQEGVETDFDHLEEWHNNEYAFGD